MYKRLSAILFPIVTIALIGSGLWGYQEHQEKNAILIKAENQYQRAFHDLSYYMGQLNDELGKSMVVNSTSQEYQKRKLIQVWRMTSQAQNQINQLPLTLLPFNKTEEFLDKIASFTYRASVRDLTKEPLSKDELGTLRTLYDRSKELTTEIRNIQAKVLDQNLRWMDVEVALATQNKKMDNTIIDGFKTVDNKVTEYSEVSWGPSVQSLYEKRTLSSLSGDLISEAEAKEKALQFLGKSGMEDVLVTENGKGTEYQSYSVSFYEDDILVNVDVAKRGGHLLWFMKPREVTEQQLSIDQALQEAQQYLKEHNYNNLVPTNYDQYNNISSLTFAHVEDGIVYYPKRLTVKVALDNGEVTGIQANDYVYENEKPEETKADLTMAEASEGLHPSFKKRTSGKAYIKNELDQKVLCYEFTGKINGQDYRIFINADTGFEEKVETIQQAEAAFQQQRGE
jgi:spore germination protein